MLERDRKRAVLVVVELDELCIVEVVRRDGQLDARVGLELVAADLLERRLRVHLDGLCDARIADGRVELLLHGGIVMEDLLARFLQVELRALLHRLGHVALDGGFGHDLVLAERLSDLGGRLAEVLHRFLRRGRQAALEQDFRHHEDGVAVERVLLGCRLDGLRPAVDEGELVDLLREVWHDGIVVDDLVLDAVLRLVDLVREADVVVAAQDDEVWHLVNARLCDDDIGCGHLLGVCQGVVECLGNRLA